MPIPIFVAMPSQTYILLKPCQNKKGRKFVSAAPERVSFSQLLAVRKKNLFGAANFFTNKNFQGRNLSAV